MDKKPARRLGDCGVHHEALTNLPLHAEAVWIPYQDASFADRHLPVLESAHPKLQAKGRSKRCSQSSKLKVNCHIGTLEERRALDQTLWSMLWAGGSLSSHSPESEALQPTGRDSSEGPKNAAARKIVRAWRKLDQAEIMGLSIHIASAYLMGYSFQRLLQHKYDITE